jgi:EEF1A lysine methyltransferase 2
VPFIHRNNGTATPTPRTLQTWHKRIVTTPSTPISTFSPTAFHDLLTSRVSNENSWDNLYTKELSNNTADPADIGTVWFDDSDAEAKTLSFLSALPLDPASASVLDLGCGNGSLLFSLRDYGEDEEDDGDGEESEVKKGWTGRMLGVDYSPQSVALAEQILASSTTEGKNRGDISFREWDLLSGPWATVLDGAQAEGWDVVHDKGTFDAISLSDATDAQGRRICEGYKARALRLVRRGGYFVITSCNWTEPELKAWFAPGDEEIEAGGDNFVVDGRVEYRTFLFGGVKGQTVTTLCFRRTGATD